MRISIKRKGVCGTHERERERLIITMIYYKKRE